MIDADEYLGVIYGISGQNDIVLCNIIPKNIATARRHLNRNIVLF